MKRFFNSKKQFYKKVFDDYKMLAYNQRSTIICENFEHDKLVDITSDKHPPPSVEYRPVFCIINKSKFITALKFLVNVIKDFKNIDNGPLSNVYFLTDRDGLTVSCFTDNQIYYYRFKCKIYNKIKTCISYKDCRLLIKYIDSYFNDYKTLELWCSSDYFSVSNLNFGKYIEKQDIMFHFKKTSYSYVLDNNSKYFKRYKNISFSVNKDDFINLLESNIDIGYKFLFLFINPYSKKLVFYDLDRVFKLVDYIDINFTKRLPLDGRYKILYIYNLFNILNVLNRFESENILISYDPDSSLTPISLIDTCICTIMPMDTTLFKLDKNTNQSNKFLSRYYRTRGSYGIRKKTPRNRKD